MIVIGDIGMMHIEIEKYRLDFKFQAGTSRGVMTKKDSWFIKVRNQENSDVFGIGECGPLSGLSPDLSHDLEDALHQCVQKVGGFGNPDEIKLEEIIPNHFPALKFALETAFLDLKMGGRRILFENEFTGSEQPIPINGLVWMGDRELMLRRIKEKIDEGFDCIKIKIGAINFDDELNLLKYIRSNFSQEQITIRLDANGAFDKKEVFTKLDQLSKYAIHSIEQPIQAGDWKAMSKVCQESPIPIALDEELIGVNDSLLKAQLMHEIKPDFIILKPTLLGGFGESAEWIDLAESNKIGWWMTSALESNVGLNAIAQFTAKYKITLPQGLGTGQLFHNNISSPLVMENGKLYYKKDQGWNAFA